MLTGLRTKGETQEEIAGLAATMRRLATPVTTRRDGLVDIGGHRRRAAVVQRLHHRGAHRGRRRRRGGQARQPDGSRACGSADVLEALGVRIDLKPDQVGRCLDEIGFGFMFAPAHHGATRYVIPVRRSLAVRTIFNLLGPLTNPAGARRQLTGVSDPAYMESMAGALAQLGAERALVVSSEDGLDELSIAAPTQVVEVNGTDISAYTVSPEDVGLPTTTDPQATAGGVPAVNAEITRAILAGEPGPRRDLAVLNAGAAIYAGGGAADLAWPACSPPRRRSRTARPPRRSRARRRDQPLASGSARRSPAVDGKWERPRADRREHAGGRPAAPGLRAPARARAGARSSRRPAVLRSADAAQRVAHRRAQAALPSAGTIREGATVADVVRAYERGGAAAVSVLTEGAHFAGSLDDLRVARESCDLPILRKDFIVDEYQVYETAAAGRTRCCSSSPH